MVEEKVCLKSEQKANGALSQVAADRTLMTLNVDPELRLCTSSDLLGTLVPEE